MSLSDLVIRVFLLFAVAFTIIYSLNTAMEPVNVVETSKNECRAALSTTPQHIAERFCRDVAAAAIQVRY